MKPFFKNKLSYFFGAIFSFLIISCESESFEIQNEETNSITADKDALVEVELNGEKILVKERGDTYTLGDMIFPKETIDSNKSVGRVANRWPNNTLLYALDTSISSAIEENINVAIQHWRLFTDIEFVNVTGTISNTNGIVLFYDGGECSSFVGYLGDIEHNISLSSDCGVKATIHEIGHILGLWHEQSRVDRDDHIIVKYDNIVPSQIFQFQTYVDRDTDGAEYTDFDFNSIMLYESFFLTQNGSATITKLNGATFTTPDVLSVDDVEGIKTMYPSISDEKTMVSVFGSFTNSYVSSENGQKPITCNRKDVGSWEEFEFIPLGGGEFALYGNNRRFLSTDASTGEMTCNSRNLRDAQKFTLDYADYFGGRAFFTIKTREAGNWVVSSNGELDASNLSGAGGDAIFAIEIL